jgi:Autophagocytosis associated protein, active-site domain
LERTLNFDIFPPTSPIGRLRAMDSASFANGAAALVECIQRLQCDSLAAKVASYHMGAALVLNDVYVVVWSVAYNSPELYAAIHASVAQCPLEMSVDCNDTDALAYYDSCPLMQRVSATFHGEAALRITEHPLNGQGAVCVNACNARRALLERMQCKCATEIMRDAHWIAAFLSLYGPSVGLSIPAALFSAFCV